jgi:hypothetical protein
MECLGGGGRNLWRPLEIYLLDTSTPVDSNVVLMEEVLITSVGKENTKAVKYKKTCISLYAIAMNHMKQLRLLTKANTDECPESEALKVKKACVAKYRRR